MDALLGWIWFFAATIGGSGDDPACLVLGGLDSVRAEAFVSGEEDRLRDVYIDDRAIRADVAVLRSYRARGLRLEGMELVRDNCAETQRSSDRIELDVIDRLGPTAVRSSDDRRRELPRDRPTRRVVVLHRSGDVWRVAAVRPG